MDFTNPVLNADWPDPDVVRVGDDYYLVVSSFDQAPGLPVPHSRALATWEVGADIGLFAAAPLGTPGNHGHAAGEGAS